MHAPLVLSPTDSARHIGVIATDVWVPAYHLAKVSESDVLQQH
jgi:hypothetical protein